MAKARERAQTIELSSAFHKKADQELERLRETVAGNLRDEMISLLEDEIHSDLLITNGVTVVRAHKCIVQARCRHLWQESWLSLGPDPDTSDVISCLEMPGLSRAKLLQFVRSHSGVLHIKTCLKTMIFHSDRVSLPPLKLQLYSVSDSVLLLEDYIEDMPGGARSLSLALVAHNSLSTEDSFGSSSQIKVEQDTSSSEYEVDVSGYSCRKGDDLKICTKGECVAGNNSTSRDNMQNVLTNHMLNEENQPTMNEGELKAVDCNKHGEQSASAVCKITQEHQVSLDEYTSEKGTDSSKTGVHRDSCSSSTPTTNHVSKNISSDQMVNSLETARVSEPEFNSQDISAKNYRQNVLTGSECVDYSTSLGSINEDLLNFSSKLEASNVPTADDDEQERHRSSRVKTMSFDDLVTSDSTSASCKACSPLGRDLLNMYSQQLCCDCCLSVDGVHFMAHKCILSARSEYFLAMFGGQWSESQMAAVNLEAVSPQAVRQLLLFLYGGVTDLCAASNMKELFLIADMYGVLTFRTVLMFYVKKDLCHFFHKPCPSCMVTTSEALMLCQNFYLEELQVRCLKWMAKYFTKIWPTKAFSMLEDSLHQMCFDCILEQMTASNVLDTVLECSKLVSSLPRIKWTENVLYLVTRLMDTAIEYTSSHFVDVLKTKEFLLWAKVASWKASSLEDIFYSVIDSLPVDTACLVFLTLIKLQEFHSNPENPEPEIAGLLEAMIRRCEKFFKTHIHHVTRSRQWSALPQPVQTRILEISAYVYLPEPGVDISLRQNFGTAGKIKCQKTDRTQSVVSSGSRTGATKAVVYSRTPSSSSRQAGKALAEIRLAKSLPGSHWSGSKGEEDSVQGTVSVMRTGNRHRLRTTSSSQASPASERNTADTLNPDLTSTQAAGHKSSKVRNLEGRSLSQIPKSGKQSCAETAIGEVSLDKVKTRQSDIEAHGGSLRNEQTWRFSFPPLLRSNSDSKKLSPLGQTSQISSMEVKQIPRRDKLSPTKNLPSKLPTPVRLQRSSLTHRPTSIAVDDISQYINPSMLTSVESAIDFISEVSNDHVTADTTNVSVQDSRNRDVLLQVLQIVSADTSQNEVSAGIKLSCTSSENLDTSCYSTYEVAQHLRTSSDDLTKINKASGNSKHAIDLSNFDKPLTEHIHTITPFKESEHFIGSCQLPSLAETADRSDSNSNVSYSMLTSVENVGKDISKEGVAELQPEVRIVHMSKTLNVGFIVPPD